MKEELYISLLYQQLSGQLEASDAAKLKEWLDASEENRLIAASVEKAWTLSSNYNRPDVKVDLDADFTELESKMDGLETVESIPNKNTARQRALPPQRNWLNIAAALLLLVSVGFLLRNYFIDSLEPQRFTLGAGETKALTLGDGTKIWVNENSTIAYPGVFDKKERRVALTGEAYFEVAENPAQPFIIETKNGAVKVLGTSFNVRDYPEQAEMAVEVLTGKVELSTLNNQQKLVLTINEKGILDKKNLTLQKEEKRLGNAAFWHTGKLTFKETPLQSVLEDLEQRFSTNIRLESAEMRDCPFTSSFEQKDLSYILTVIETVFSMKLILDKDNSYSLHGGVCS